MPSDVLDGSYNVSFYYNYQKVGYYEREVGEAIVWYAPALVSSFTLSRGSEWTYPSYTAHLLPVNRQALGNYQCSVSWIDPVSRELIEKQSSIWYVQNSAFKLYSCNFIVLALLLSLICKSVLW